MCSKSYTYIPCSLGRLSPKIALDKVLDKTKGKLDDNSQETYPLHIPSYRSRALLQNNKLPKEMKGIYLASSITQL